MEDSKGSVVTGLSVFDIEYAGSDLEPLAAPSNHSKTLPALPFSPFERER